MIARPALATVIMWCARTFGWALVLLSVTSAHGQGCGGHLPGPKGVFYSEGYFDRGTYPLLKRTCIWTVTVLEGGYASLRFVDFLVYDNFDSRCHYDRVCVYDGVGSGSDHLLARLCGDLLPPLLIGSGNILEVHFATDTLDSFRGFVAVYGDKDEVEPRLRTCSVSHTSNLTMFSGETGSIRIPCTYIMAHFLCAQYSVQVMVTNGIKGNRVDMFYPQAVEVVITSPWSVWRGVVTPSSLEQAHRYPSNNPWYITQNTESSIVTFFDPISQLAELQHRRIGLNNTVLGRTPNDLVLDVGFSFHSGVKVMCDAMLTSEPYPKSLCGEHSNYWADRKRNKEENKKRKTDRKKNREKRKRNKLEKKRNREVKKKNKLERKQKKGDKGKNKEGGNRKNRKEKRKERRNNSSGEGVGGRNVVDVLRARQEQLNVTSPSFAIIYDVLLNTNANTGAGMGQCSAIADKFQQCSDKPHAINICGVLFIHSRLSTCLGGDWRWFEACLDTVCNRDANSCHRLRQNLMASSSCSQFYSESFLEISGAINSVC